MLHIQPRKRSKIRSFFGIKTYSFLKHFYWIKNSNKFSNGKSEVDLPYVIFSHKTPLLRLLKDVDMLYQHNKIQNLKIATKKIDGLVITPGQTFSFWKCIGSLTKRKGYLEGIELYYGKFRPGIGGGLCQLSNLLYWMFLHSPLIVTERHRHSYDVFPDIQRKLPFGSGATCYYPFMDLEVMNASDQEFQIRLKVTDESLEGEIRSRSPLDVEYEVQEKDHHFKPEFWGGYSRNNQIIRNTYKNKVLIKTETIAENRAMCMYEPFLGENK